MLSRVDNLASAASSGTVYAQYGYLGAGTIYQVTHPAVTSGLKLTYDLAGDHSLAGLDRFGRAVDQKWTNDAGSTTFDRYTYGYSASGNRLYRENTQSTTKSEYYTYDSLDRLSHGDRGTLNTGKTAISTLAYAQDWTLDKLGNWTTFKIDADGNGNYSSSGDLNHDRSHNAANETGTITTNFGSSWISPVHDAAGNMIEMPIPGNETVKEKAVYDAWNRLVQVTDASNTIIATYRYNGLNYRVQKLLGSNPSSPTSTFDYFYNGNWQILEERKDGSANPSAQYVWDLRYIDAPVCRFRDSNTDGTLDDTLYYCNDANMNVTALVDTSATVQERYAYDAYGKVSVFDGSWGTRTTSAYDNQILFAGYRFDPETGLYHVRNRPYHPMLGWLQRDPLGYVDTKNLYTYVRDNPLKGTDPTGKVTVSNRIPYGCACVDPICLWRWGYGKGHCQCVVDSIFVPAGGVLVNKLSVDMAVIASILPCCEGACLAKLISGLNGRNTLQACLDAALVVEFSAAGGLVLVNCTCGP